MKISLVILVVITTGSFTLLAKNGNAQNLKDVRISMSIREKSLDAVLADIERSSNFHFVYVSELIKDMRVKKFAASQKSVEEILKQLLLPRGLTFRQRGENVAIDAATGSNGHRNTANDVIQASPFIQVVGKIVDQNGEALPGVTISIKENGRSVSSGTNGTFTISAEKGQTLVFSFIGYKKLERIIDQATINIAMQLESNQLTDVVVVGYGTQRRGDVTTAISSLRAEDVNNFTGTGVDKAMTGKMAGVQVLEPDGSPGAGIAIAIRGKATVTAGTTPLYVIDGIPLSEQNSTGPGSLSENPLNAINLADIESIDVLKDASAAAIYGSRGSNGVVIITTKKGKKGKPVVSYNGYYGFAKVQNELPMLDAYGYAKLVYDAHNNTYFDALADKGLTGSASDDNATRLAKLGGSLGASTFSTVVLPYVAGTPGLTNTNWQDAIFRNAPIENHTVSVSGGTDNTKYYVSGNYLNQNGTVIKTGYKRY